MANPFDQFDTQAQPVPVEQIRPLQPILTDPNKARAESRAQEAENRQQEQAAVDTAKSSFRTMTPAEAEAQGLPSGGVYQINGLGEIKTIQAATKSAATENKLVAQSNAQNLLQAAGVTADNDPVADLIRGSTSGYIERAGAAMPEAFGSTTSGMENIARLETIVADMTLALTGGSLGAGVSNADVAFLKQRVGNLADPTIPADRRLAAWEEVKGRLQRVAGEMPSAMTPTGEGPAPTISGEGETFLTPEDMELQARLNAAYKSGASLQELQAISAEYNRTFPIGSQQELDAARQQGRTLNVNPSGQRTAAMEVLGSAAETPAGAYFVSAANGLASGFMDELAPVLGLDAATVQGAKEYLREKYPVESFAGEVSGQALQLGAAGVGLRAAGVGAKGLAGAEIAQGAAYGAGEANENRLLGAAAGAGATFAGQKLAGAIASRFATPEVQAVVEQVAQETGAPREVVEQTIAEAVENAAGRQLAQPVTEEAATEFGALAQQAVGKGRSAKRAQEQLAIVAQVNPEAKAAAERLGIEVPLDVLSDDVRMMTTTGLARSQIGSEAQGTWQQSVANAVQRSDETLNEIGATRDLAQVSDDVRARLERNIGDFEAQASILRGEVDDAINVRDRVDATNLQQALAETINDLGGIAEAKQAFTAEEKKLLAMLGEGEQANRPTYAYLNQVRDQIGRALNKGQGPWVDAPTALLKKYYGALAKDQLAYVESVGGKELADKMRGSNELFTQMFRSRETMQSIFGQKLERDIGGLINRTITGAAKGDAQNLRTLLKAVPDDMKPRVLLSGLMSQAERNSRGGGFSFNDYAKLYRGIRQNAPIYKQIVDIVGPKQAQILQDLYVISNRMAQAEAKIVRTGASNQPILNALKAESLVSKTVEATKRVGGRGAGAIAGGVVGGPMGSFAGQEIGGALTDALTAGGKSNLDKLHALLASEGFRDLTQKVAAGENVERAAARIANDGPFRKFAASVLGIKDPAGRKNWLLQAMQSAGTVGAVGTATTEQPTSIIEVR